MDNEVEVVKESNIIYGHVVGLLKQNIEAIDNIRFELEYEIDNVPVTRGEWVESLEYYLEALDKCIHGYHKLGMRDSVAGYRKYGEPHWLHIAHVFTNTLRELEGVVGVEKGGGRRSDRGRLRSMINDSRNVLQGVIRNLDEDAVNIIDAYNSGD